MNELTLANWEEHVKAVDDNDGEWSIDWGKFIQTLLDLQKEETTKEKDDSYEDLRRCFVALIKQLGEVKVSAKTLAEVNLDTEVVQFGIDSESEEMIFKYKG